MRGIIITLILLGAIVGIGLVSQDNPPASGTLIFPDSTGTSDSIMIPSGLSPLGLFTVDSLDNDSANVSFEISYGNQPSRIWYEIMGADTVIRDSSYYTLSDILKSVEGLSEVEVPVWIRTKTDSLQDGDRSIRLRFGTK